MYEWSYLTSISVATNKANISRVTVIQRYQYFIGVCTKYLLNNLYIFGGENCIVQIDESMFTKVKNIRGELTENTTRKKCI